MTKQKPTPIPPPEVMWCPICRQKPVTRERIWHGKWTKCCDDCNLANDGT